MVMHYRLRDLMLAPALISWVRLPLAACFPLVVGRPVAAVAVLLAAGFSDVLDGWVARRYGLVTPTGAALDPITDKLFVLTVAITLLVHEYLPLGGVLLLSTREIGELPLVVWLARSHTARAARANAPSANAGGKLATVLQFSAVSWALLRQPLLGLWVGAAAVAGVVAAIGYWRRALQNSRPSSADRGSAG